MMLKNKKPMVFWTREQKKAREEQMEQLHPGYFEQKEKTLVLLGAAIFLRGVYQALTMMINQAPFVYSLFMFLGLFITYCVYIFAARSRLLAGCLFGVRILELVRILAQTLPPLFYFPFLLKIWWVAMMFVFVLDLFYLGQPLFNKKAIRQTVYYQMLDSSEELPQLESVVEGAVTSLNKIESDEDEAEEGGQR